MAWQWDNVAQWSADPINERWRLLQDINRDGTFTVTDTIQWLGYFFHAPGDGLITAVCVWLPNVAQFLEIGPADFGGFASGVMSLIFWLGIFEVWRAIDLARS